MFAIPGIVLLVGVIYARPHEVIVPLAGVPVLHLLFAFALVGMVIDLRASNTRLRSTPLSLWVALLMLWSFITVFVRAPRTAPDHALGLAICAALFVLLAHGVQTFRALGVVAGAVLAAILFVSSVAVEQRFAPLGCIQIDESNPNDTTSGWHDGRPCETPRDCYVGDLEPGAEYVCEHVGWLGTSSVGKGRVRYRGILQDPNELALAGAIGLPLAFAFAGARKKSVARRLLLFVTLALVLVCAVLTQSRSGQIVFAVVLAVLYARRFGVLGLAIGAILATPLLIFGGRAGMEASSSTQERVESWSEALEMWRSHPFVGVGLGQFGEYHYLTAHNSYLLSLAELGIVGMLLFSIIVYLAIKIPLAAWRASDVAESPLSGDDAREIVRPWAMAMLASFAGLAVGIFFLSFAYHYVLWIYFGLAGAFYSAIRTHDPGFEVRFGWRDLALVASLDLAIIVLVHFYARFTFA